MIDTKEVREQAAMRAFTTNPVPSIVIDLCDEVDRLRGQVDANNALMKKAQDIIGSYDFMECGHLREKVLELQKQRDDWRDNFERELDGNKSLRKEFHAREHETMRGFIERLFNESGGAKFRAKQLERLENEVARLRAELAESTEAYREKIRTMHESHLTRRMENEALRKDVAALRERLGEKACSKCGAHALVLHYVTVEVDETAHGGERNGPYDRICRKCIDNAVAALSKP